MNKKLVKILSLVSVLSLFTVGCNNGGSSAQSSDKKVKIEYWHVNAETQGGKSVDKLVEEFNKQSDTVEVVAKYNPDMYKGLLQNFQAEAATGSTPDLIQVGWSFLDYFSNNFAYTKSQDIIDKYFPEDKTFLEDNFLPNILDLAKNSEGSQVGIPYSLSTPVLYINKDILKECGLDENGPRTWEQVQKFAKTIKEKSKKYGVYIQEPADNWATQALLESNGARMIADGKATFASEKGIEAYEAYADMVKNEEALHISWDEGVQSFINGEVGMLYTTIARRASIQEGASFDVAAVNSPVWEGEDVRLPAGGCFLAITAQDEEKQKAAWEFQKYLYNVESMAEWTIGTGYVPPRKDVAEAKNGLKDFLKENEMMKAATSQIEGVVSWTSFPGDAGLEAEQILLDTRDQILGGKISAKDGLTDAQNKINKLLEKQ
ncbi:ABC transporter substrate-binding protein [Terrisporobacter glycolicus]|uniref:Sn-glycerol-3-phosphate-binding periplasmic protein UgpB n=1 Tax=Terrisporobacter glycolicus ATCC 14880 = DSM 1288 TaxID=1121315 RepID=A0ABZ2ERS1_9FIRM|nr:ABC transporter substrate-binding protein [Terrisporobacter glycolicus]